AVDDGSFVPVPESLPSVQARSLGTEDAYVAHEGASLAFSWKTTGGETHTQTLTFEGAGLAFQDGVTELDAAALLAFLNDAFEANEGGAIFRARAGVGDAGPIVEPNVATRGRLTITAPANGTLDLSGETLNFTIGGAPAISIVVADEFANPAAVSQSQLVEVLSARLGAANLVEPRGDEVIIRTRAVADGAAPAFSQAPGTNGLTVAALAGSGGLVLETPEGVTLVVSEEPNRHFPRTLRDIGFASRAEGYEQDSPKNPLVRPRATTDMIRLLGGTDGTGPVTSADFGRALAVLDRVEFQLLAFPGRTGTAFINAGLGYCDRRGDCFFIADGPGHVDPNLAVSPGDARSFVDALPNRSNNGAMYYPWLLVPDPVGAGRNPRRFVPPSGHIAGIFARTDNRRGVWKAPAGIEATVTGAIGLQWQLIDSEQDILNPVGLNAIRQFPGAGIVCWGSRTLASDPEWRYVPVRRLALFLKSSLQRGLQWAVFEPNDAELWGRIQVNITAFMLSLFGQGAFQGSTPEDAFNVLCDRSTNPQELIDAGIVTARVAFAPLKPAEFVVIQIVQKTLVEG
ncbi:MAG TPA: phage tail sheath subtilisin-like domain-containing protein, partial [Polyangiaceae bacterium]|nr:phage tail sheath subtilisin-like domain-containing protein [Polyangiaceae bacterium]